MDLANLMPVWGSRVWESRVWGSRLWRSRVWESRGYRATDFGSGSAHSGGLESGGLESRGLESGGLVVVVDSCGLLQVSLKKIIKRKKSPLTRNVCRGIQSVEKKASRN